MRVTDALRVPNPLKEIGKLPENGPERPFFPLPGKKKQVKAPIRTKRGFSMSALQSKTLEVSSTEEG